MNDNWSTPIELFNELHEEFGFNLDACASDWNHKCENYFTEEDNALKQDWYPFGSVWMNPPYSGNQLSAWVKKAHEESLKGGYIVGLVPVRTETGYFQNYCLKYAELRFIRGRVHFTDENGKSGRPRFGSVIIIFRPWQTIGFLGKPLKYTGGK
jgi:phage N-6-adenine-methyltransferase